MSFPFRLSSYLFEVPLCPGREILAIFFCQLTTHFLKDPLVRDERFSQSFYPQTHFLKESFVRDERCSLLTKKSFFPTDPATHFHQARDPLPGRDPQFGNPWSRSLSVIQVAKVGISSTG